jgi:hypothetical protein
VEQNTSKLVVARDTDLATTTLTNASGAGSSLFVINLCASMAPLASIGKSLPGFEAYRLYQVARREDGRTRHRLRLGFFPSEADAEAVLNLVRSSYPTAFTACLCDEDQKFLRGYAAESTSQTGTVPRIAVVVANKAIVDTIATAARPAASKPTPAAPTKPVVAKTAGSPSPSPSPLAPAKTTAIPANASGELKKSPTTVAAPAHPSVTSPHPSKPAASGPLAKPNPAPAAPRGSTPTAKATTPIVASAIKTREAVQVASAPQARAAAAPTPTIDAPSKLLATIELSLEAEPKPASHTESAKAPSSEPFRVSKGVNVPTTPLTLEAAWTSATATKPVIAPTPPASPKSLSDTSKMKLAHASASAAIQAAAAPAAAPSSAGKLPDLDSTQTIRALTSDELQDESQEKWFAIQLAASDQPVNLDAMPRLDIFEAYRLYSVASAGSGKITHSLRIGFFREKVSAEAVCGYLKTFFAAPTVVRISIAEQTRFKDPPTAKAAAKSEAKVLDLSHARDRTKAIPTVTMAVATPRFDPGATSSFKTSATGAHKALATGSHQAMNATGSHRAFGATGSHPAMKTATAAKSAPVATKRSEPLAKAMATGKHKAFQPRKSLSQQLLDEAREVELSESGIRKLPKNPSLLAKMFGKKK